MHALDELEPYEMFSQQTVDRITISIHTGTIIVKRSAGSYPLVRFVTNVKWNPVAQFRSHLLSHTL